jgi:hypothetical protein
VQGRDGVALERWHFKPVPKVEPDVRNEAIGHHERERREAKGKREKVDVEEVEVKEEKTRIEANRGGGTHGYC